MDTVFPAGSRTWLVMGLLLAASPALAAPKCLNTKDGGFDVKGTLHICRVREFFDDNGAMAAQSFGLAKGVSFDLDFQLDLSPKVLKQVLLKKSLTLPQQKVKAEVHTVGDQKLPVAFALAPTVVFDEKNFPKKFRAKDARLGLVSVKSPLLPGKLEKYLVKALNDNKDLRAKLVEVTNQGLAGLN